MKSSGDTSQTKKTLPHPQVRKRAVLQDRTPIDSGAGLLFQLDGFDLELDRDFVSDHQPTGLDGL